MSRRPTRAITAAITVTWLLAGQTGAVGAARASATQELPVPWTSRDIGAVGLAGSASHAAGTFTVRGAGADIWGAADSFHFVSQPMTGNGEIVARVATVQNTHTYAKAGVMIRGALTAGSAHVILDVKPGGGIEFMSRNANGGATAFIAGAVASAPVWLRLVREGSTVIGSWSSNGSAWTEVGRTTISLPTTIYAGLPVTSHNTSVINTSTLDNVRVAPEVPNQLPTVTIVTPTDAAVFEAPATVAIVATASDTDGAISSVQFLANNVSIGIDTTSPYEMTWTQVPVGSYTLVAVATDSRGDQAQSAAVRISVTTSSDVPPPDAPGASLPANGSTNALTSVALNWAASQQATHYDVALGTTAAPPTVSINQTATYYQPPAPLSHNTTYYWRVTAKNAGGSAMGPLWSFTTQSPPSPVTPPPSTSLRRLRVMTWNVNGGRNFNHVSDVSAQVSLMARSGAHVIVLQEVTVQSGADLRALYQSELSTATGRTWYAVWAEEPHSAPATPQGNLILSVLPLASEGTIDLEGAPFDPSNVDAQRSAARLAVVVNGVTVTVAGTTLASDAESREAQIGQLASWMNTAPGPRLIGGTFNMRLNDAVYTEMAATFADVWSSLVTTPDAGITTASFGTPAQPARVDGWWQELSGGNAVATEVWIVKTARSDHHAVIAEVNVR